MNRLTVPFIALGLVAVGLTVVACTEPAFAAPNVETVLPADGVVSIERSGDDFRFTFTGVPTEVKYMTSGSSEPHPEVCGVNAQLNYGEPLCATVIVVEIIGAPSCTYWQVDGIPGVNSSDPFVCHALPSPTPTVSPTPTETPTWTPTPSPSATSATPTPTPSTSTSTPSTATPTAQSSSSPTATPSFTLGTNPPRTTPTPISSPPGDCADCVLAVTGADEEQIVIIGLSAIALILLGIDLLLIRTWRKRGRA